MWKEDDNITNPKFITFEGIDKTGKTLFCEILKTEYPNCTCIHDPIKLKPWNSIFTTGTIYGVEIPQISESFFLLSARLHGYREKIKKFMSVIKKRLNLTENKTKYEKDPKKQKKVQDNYLKLAKEYHTRYYIIKDRDQGVIQIYNKVKDVLKNKGFFDAQR